MEGRKKQAAVRLSLPQKTKGVDAAPGMVSMETYIFSWKKVKNKLDLNQDNNGVDSYRLHLSETMCQKN